MSSNSAPIVALQPVQLHDEHGLNAAVYSISALYLRSGKPTLNLSSVRPRIASLIRAADPHRLSLLLQEWYHEVVDEVHTAHLVRSLPDMLDRDDPARYKHNPIVNDVEWTALATIFRCCIAVKFLSPRNSPGGTASTPAWKIAVPTPGIFGLPPSNSGTRGPGGACVFLVCHSSPALTTYVPLIPCDQQIFKPGRPLLGKQRASNPAPSASNVTDSSQSKGNGTPNIDPKVDAGDNPGVVFEGYRPTLTSDATTPKEKRVTFAKLISTGQTDTDQTGTVQTGTDQTATVATPQLVTQDQAAIISFPKRVAPTLKLVTPTPPAAEGIPTTQKNAEDTVNKPAPKTSEQAPPPFIGRSSDTNSDSAAKSAPRETGNKSQAGSESPAPEGTSLPVSNVVSASQTMPATEATVYVVIADVSVAVDEANTTKEATGVNSSSAEEKAMDAAPQKPASPSTQKPTGPSIVTPASNSIPTTQTDDVANKEAVSDKGLATHSVPAVPTEAEKVAEEVVSEKKEEVQACCDAMHVKMENNAVSLPNTAAEVYSAPSAETDGMAKGAVPETAKQGDTFSAALHVEAKTNGEPILETKTATKSSYVASTQTEEAGQEAALVKAEQVGGKTSEAVAHKIETLEESSPAVEKTLELAPMTAPEVAGESNTQENSKKEAEIGVAHELEKVEELQPQDSPMPVIVTAEKSKFVPETKDGRIELKIGELSEATVLFQRVYGGGEVRKESSAGMHGKIAQSNESMEDIINRMYSAVH